LGGGVIVEIDWQLDSHFPSPLLPITSGAKAPNLSRSECGS
jgi:hypothetical protein